MTGTGRSAGVLLAVAAMTLSAAACTTEGSDGGEGSDSCAYRFSYRGRMYQDVANVDFAVGKRLGTATHPPCNDTGRQDQAEEPTLTETAYAVDGISPTVAIAVGSTPEDVMFLAVYSAGELPPEVKKLLDRP